jgi:hypothetical protein
MKAGGEPETVTDFGECFDETFFRILKGGEVSFHLGKESKLGEGAETVEQKVKRKEECHMKILRPF